MKIDRSITAYSKKDNKKIFRFLYWERVDLCLVCGKDVYTHDELHKIGLEKNFPKITPDVQGEIECGVLKRFEVNMKSKVNETFSATRRLLAFNLGIEVFL